MTYLELCAKMWPLEGVQYPHCDWRILHSPGVCAFCDEHSDWQQERIALKVLFTDDPENQTLVNHVLSTGRLLDDRKPCPGFTMRGASIHNWGGNTPKSEGYK